MLGDMPQKTFELDRMPPRARAARRCPPDLTVRDALDRVLRLLSVGSKRFLTTKVDRSVTGLVARQQCAGPLQLTVADVAVIAQSHFGTTGAATAIGEQPIKGLLDPAAMARMTVGEALTNLVWARSARSTTCAARANWMWAAKLPGEGAALYDAAVAMRDVMLELGHRGRRRQGQPLDGRPRARRRRRRRDREGAGRAGDLGLRHLPRHHARRSPRT